MQSFSDDGGGVVYPNPATSCVYGAAEDRVREGRDPPANASKCVGVLFTHEPRRRVVATLGQGRNRLDDCGRG